MRSLPLAILLVVAVLTVLGFSMRSLRKERERLRQAFVSSRQSDVRELASDLQDQLRDIEENARVIATLVSPAHDPSSADRPNRTPTLGAWFDAMTTVIGHYRSLVLVAPNTTRPVVVAVDPTEDRSVASELVRASCADGWPPLPRGLSGPVQLAGGRVFYFYKFPAGMREVVLSIDGPVFMQSAVRSLAESGIVVDDPGGAEWSRSRGATSFSVRSSRREDGEASRWSGVDGFAWLDQTASRQFNLPAGSALAVWASASSSALGTWRVVLLRPAYKLDGRNQAVVRQVVVTAVGLIAAIGLVGIFIIRQQRHSAVLVERLRSAEALRSLERQLISAEKLSTTGVLAAGIAHEVGTPLGIIRARAELLLDEIDRLDSRRALEAIVQQIDRIASIIRQVLDFSRIQPVEVAKVDVKEGISLALELLGHRFRQQKLTVDVDVVAGVPAVAADANQFQQVLINLLLNACDACQPGDQVHVAAQLIEAERVSLEIRDRGQGIAPEHLLAVFDPFFTTKKRGEGTGLGLPIAASIVRNHGGEINLASKVGEGTTVTIKWPAAAGESHA